jgi:8-oxo-dGTP pyrophosphatase MutT (NUDIX family)
MGLDNTMHENELWQVFNDNGSPILGKGATCDEFKANPSMITGNVHVWFWKKSEDGVEILLQKRSWTKEHEPGRYHMSAGGHINVSETTLQTAIRETQEEMGIVLDTSKLHFFYTTRTVHRSPNDIKHVYLYRLNGDEKFTFDDGEVDSVEWRTLENFKQITKEPDANNLVNMGYLYFDTLIASLEYVSSNKNEDRN